MRARLGVADGGGDARARHLAELDGGHADAAGGAVDEQALAGAQPGLGEERVVGGGEDLGHAARGLPVELLGDRHRGALVDDRELGLAAAGDDRHHAVAGLEALDAGAALDDLARQLEAGDVLRRAGRRRVAALELHDVGAVEPGARGRGRAGRSRRGPGSGCSSTAIEPSRMVAARIGAMLPPRPREPSDRPAALDDFRSSCR